MTTATANRVLPAHRVGKRIQGAKTIQEALAAANLAGEVKVSETPVSSAILTPNGVSTLTIADKFITYRETSDGVTPLGVVGSRYVPIQDLEAFDFLNLLIDESGLEVAGVGSMSRGKQTIIQMKIPTSIKVGGYDDVDLYLLAQNSHDGSTAFNVAVTPVRLRCTNQVRMALRTSKSKIAIKHTSSALTKVAQARETLKMVFEYQESFEREVEKLLSQEFLTDEYEKFVETLVPLDYKNASKAQITTAENTRQDLMNLWYADTQAPIFGSKWGAYNAVAEYADWIKPVRGAGDKEALRAERILSGATEELKNKALALL